MLEHIKFLYFGSYILESLLIFHYCGILQIENVSALMFLKNKKLFDVVSLGEPLNPPLLVRFADCAYVFCCG